MEEDAGLAYNPALAAVETYGVEPKDGRDTHAGRFVQNIKAG